MRILVTRPFEDAQEAAQALRLLGHDPLIAPLMEIHFHDGPDISLDGVQAILATSANGVRAIAKRTRRRDVPLFAVGPQTAQHAIAAGFAVVKNAQGDSEALAAAATQWASPEGGTLLHAAGSEAPKTLAAALTQRGFRVRSVVLYDAIVAPALPALAAEALRSGGLDAVLNFSPRSARAFRDCVMRAGLENFCSPLRAFCISRATADALNGLHFREVRVAATPDQRGLFDLLEQE